MDSHLNKLFKLLELRGLDYIILGGQPNITYFTGVPKPSGCLLIVRKDGYAELLTPLLDYSRVLRSIRSNRIAVLPYTTYNISSYGEVISDLIAYVKSKLPSRVKVGMDLNYVNPILYKLTTSLGGDVVDIGSDVLNIRAIKDEYEVGFIKEALRIAEDALAKLLDELELGITELRAVGLLEKYLRDLGACGVAFDTIVASGPNTAYPHAVPSSKNIVSGEHVIVDLGAVFHLYSSDMTRTVCVGNIASEVSKTLNAVEEALVVAEDYVGPYVRVSDVDIKIREVLSRYGLENYFIHSSGHGVGIEVHEVPRIAQGVNEELKPGMVITLEPGVYVGDLYGVRIEDMVLITNSGREVMNRLSRRL